MVNGSTSEWAAVTSGIPQGSVLGPILFVIYINDMPEMVASTVYLFADDTKIYRRIQNDQDRHKLQEDLNNLQDWSDKWLLKFHPDKCKTMTISTTSKPRFQYTLTQQQVALPKTTALAHSNEEKDIGITIDSYLTFEKHMTQKVNKANQIIGLIRRTFDYLDWKSFKQLYKALVRPHVEYGNAVWQPHKKKDIKMIENVQRRATRMLPGMKDVAYGDRLRKLNLPTLLYRRLRGDMIETYNIIHGVYDEEVTKNFLLLKPQSDRNTRGHSIPQDTTSTVQAAHTEELFLCQSCYTLE